MLNNNSFKVRVLTFEQSGCRCFIGTMKAKDLIRVTTIDRYKPELPLENPDQGYQRTEEKPRVKKIANFLRKNSRPIIPTAILLSSRNIDLRYNPENREIELREANLLQIVDGQHRVAGFRYAIEEKGLTQFSEFNLPFIILDGIDKIGEMVQFKTVNGEQKSVRTDLVNTILAQLAIQEGEDSIEEKDKWKVVATNVVDILNEDVLSPWHDRIVKPGSSRYSNTEIQANQQLEHSRILRATSFVSSLRPVYLFLNSMGFLSGSLDGQSEEFAKLINDFWSAIKNKSPEMFLDANNYVIQKTPGVFSLHMILQFLLKDMYRGHRAWDKENFEVMLEDFPTVTNSDYWRVSQDKNNLGEAEKFGSMKGFKQLSELLLAEREDSMHSKVK